MSINLLHRSISIHALREEGDVFDVSVFFGIVISIHALREEGDATYKHVRAAATIISIHALREEGDPISPSWTKSRT